MKALVFSQAGVAGVEDVDEPEIGDDELLVSLRQVGVCHSDFDLLADNYIIPVQFPIIPGHEWSGEIVDVGRGVRGFSQGDRIVGECTVNGGADHFGFSISGAAAELFKIRADWAHRLPDELSWQQGATVEPFSCAFHSIDRLGGVRGGDDVAVVGGGPIGLSAVAAAVTMGGRVILVEPTESRRAFGLRMGAHDVVDPSAGPIEEQVLGLTEGRGADVVIEASGNPEAMASALEIAGYRGRLGFIGINVGGLAPTAMGLIQAKVLTITGTIGSPDIWPETIRFMSATGIDLDSMITSVFDLTDGPEALQAAEDRTNNVKVQMTAG
ncbi:zinc-dependent alcohol dehydrogenase [Candidatus Poriferisocius sp.]|uniref:zinc-dependent alcohol dehydrogenase n=1 Tax=Candidatus Poriferisocius sp. TaxID=3101276 RepID=UPI003B5B4266